MEIHNLQPQKFNENIISTGGIILDVRTQDEFERGHIEGAINIDFYHIDFDEQLRRLDKSKPYLVYCKTGGRSSQTVQLMKDIGFQHIYHLAGGITEWLSEGFPVTK